MRKYLSAFAFAILAGGLFGSSAFADDTLVRFKGGIGDIPVSNVSGTATNPPANTIFPEVTRNIVRGVNPAGQIWVIKDLDAQVKTNGDIKVRGKGLILGGGNSIGRATGQSVFATLICDVTPVTTPPSPATFSLHSTAAAGVPLAPNGDFRIDDVLVNLPPNPCVSPVLLIRNASGGTWFAAGIPDLGGKNDD